MAAPIMLSFLTSPVSSVVLIYSKQKKAFLFSIIGYLISLSMLLLGAYLNYDFIDTLKLFSLSSSFYYFGILMWYIRIIKS